MAEKGLLIQGREIFSKEIEQIRDLLAQHPDWSQWKISRELCWRWDWRNDKGQIKDIACRSLLRKLENRGYITLPPRRHKPPQRMRDQSACGEQLRFPFLTNISKAPTLKAITPLDIAIVSPRSEEGKLFAALLAKYHYLGYKGSVGEHLAYLVRDAQGCLVGCLLFGAAAWKVLPRDNYIGWGSQQRQKNLKLIANNMRFLLLNKVPHLASYLLGIIARRISRDWEEKYGHPIVMLETFVEASRFRGTCYRAANWKYVGQTQGLGRNSVGKKPTVPVKHIYLYPLIKDFRKVLCS